MTENRYAYEGPGELLPVLTAALQRVIDPEVAMNVLDVGLVYRVTAAAGRVDVTVTMTSAACPVTDVIVEDIEHQLDRSLPEEWTIHVELVWEPAWTPQRLSPKARLLMGW